MAIDPGTSVGTVRLTVSDLDRSRSFYEQVIGLTGAERDDGTVSLGAGESRPLVELRGEAAATPLQRRATGLYHLALLVPTRGDLAVVLRRLAEARWPLDGASDHLVSEALYLSDPDGNGIEIYRDRPREQWRHKDGKLEMATLPLDLRDVLSELPDGNGAVATMPAGTHVGHVHLQVAELRATESFYASVLGFDVTVRGYPGALFVSAGGYHHHIGLNTWHSAGAAPPPPDAVGLRSFEVVLPDEEAAAAVLERVRSAAIEPAPIGDSWLVRDPSGNGIVLTHP